MAGVHDHLCPGGGGRARHRGETTRDRFVASLPRLDWPYGSLGGRGRVGGLRDPYHLRLYRGGSDTTRTTERPRRASLWTVRDIALPDSCRSWPGTLHGDTAAGSSRCRSPGGHHPGAGPLPISQRALRATLDSLGGRDSRPRTSGVPGPGGGGQGAGDGCRRQLFRNPEKDVGSLRPAVAGDLAAYPDLSLPATVGTCSNDFRPVGCSLDLP